jgi:hypothetical protein
MSNKKGNIWITPHKDGWAVKREKAERSTAVTPTKEEAVKIGNELGRKDKVGVITQKKNGVIQSNDSHGHDPNPPKDTEH